jgi:hypothetical protein
MKIWTPIATCPKPSCAGWLVCLVLRVRESKASHPIGPFPSRRAEEILCNSRSASPGVGSAVGFSHRSDKTS